MSSENEEVPQSPSPKDKEDNKEEDKKEENNKEEDKKEEAIKEEDKKEEEVKKEELELLIQKINNNVGKLKSQNKVFKDYSRLYCCGSFTFGLVVILFLFYIFDILKYEATCAKSKKFVMEICDAPSISFWPRFFFIIIVSFLIIIGLYCTGPTVVIMDPIKEKVRINKKKLLFLPSIHEYDLRHLKQAMVEDDTNPHTNNSITNITFYSVTLIFEEGNFVNLGFGRDFFSVESKMKLAQDINDYLKAINIDIP